MVDKNESHWVPGRREVLCTENLLWKGPSSVVDPFSLAHTGTG